MSFALTLWTLSNLSGLRAHWRKCYRETDSNSAKAESRSRLLSAIRDGNRGSDLFPLIYHALSLRLLAFPAGATPRRRRASAFLSADLGHVADTQAFGMPAVDQRPPPPIFLPPVKFSPSYGELRRASFHTGVQWHYLLRTLCACTARTVE